MGRGHPDFYTSPGVYLWTNNAITQAGIFLQLLYASKQRTNIPPGVTKLSLQFMQRGPDNSLRSLNFAKNDPWSRIAVSRIKLVLTFASANGFEDHKDIFMSSTMSVLHAGTY